MGARVRALVTGLGVMAAVLLVPMAAQGCGCGDRDVRSALDAGYAVAVVTRTDAGPTATGGDEPATFRLEAAIGPPLPDQLHGVLDYCQGPVPPGGVEALVFQPRRTMQAGQLPRFIDPGRGDPEDLVIGVCSRSDVGTALHRIRGAPTTPGEGRAVALAWGSYDDTRWLAALDPQGRVAAWDDHEGFNVAAGACPGGQVAVVASKTYETDRFYYKLSVHELPTLRTRREIALETEVGAAPRAVRCADPHGKDVDVLAICESGSGCTGATRLIHVRDGQVTTSRSSTVDSPIPVADGFVGTEPIYEATTGESRSRVVRIAADGTRKVLGRFSGAAELAASPDGRTVAVSGWTGGLVTLDARTGRRLARWVSAKGAITTPVGWTSRGPLAVTYPPFDWHRAKPKLVAFDVDLRPVTTRAEVPSGWRTVVGDALVTFNTGRLTVTPVSGPSLAAEELLLARASGVVGVPGGSFTPEAVGAASPRTPIRVAYDGTASSGPGAGVLALSVLATAAVLWMVWRVRPRRGGQH